MRRKLIVTIALLLLSITAGSCDLLHREDAVERGRPGCLALASVVVAAAGSMTR
jgi:hypothetical protein